MARKRRNSGAITKLDSRLRGNDRLRNRTSKECELSAPEGPKALGQRQGFCGQIEAFRYQPVQGHETQAIRGRFGTEFSHPYPWSPRVT